MSLEEDLYQELLLEHSKKPRGFQRLAQATCDAHGHNPLCGDHIHVYLEVKDGVVRDVGIEGSGCVISKASASMMAEAIKGKSLTEVQKLFSTFHDLVTSSGDDTPNVHDLGDLAALSGVRKYPVRIKCATLAWHAMKAALEGNATLVSTE